MCLLENLKLPKWLALHFYWTAAVYLGFGTSQHQFKRRTRKGVNSMASLSEINVCLIVYGYSLFLLFTEMLKNQRSPEEACLIKKKKN